MFDNLPVIVTLLIALSVASERFVDILKGVIPWLNLEKANPVTEGWRKAAVQALAVLGGIVVAALSAPVVTTVLAGASSGTGAAAVPMTGGRSALSVIALGLLASGGSGFWNSILGYVQNINQLRAAQTEQHKRNTAARTTTDKGV